MKTRVLLSGLLVLLLAAVSWGEDEASSFTLALWPQRAMESSSTATEELVPSRGDNIIRMTSVTQPSITVFPARHPSPAAPAVLICPGGGYKHLAFNMEGTDLAEWFNTFGVTGVVLKYTVPQDRPAALRDAQRAMGLIRQNAMKWNINPKLVGVMGFSAGGHLAASLSNKTNREYERVDQADELSCRPDFAILVYPAYLGDRDFNLQEVMPTSETPPTFIVQAQDDKSFIASGLTYAMAVHKQGVPLELHVFPTGGHGFGMRSKKPVSEWPNLCRRWLEELSK